MVKGIKSYTEIKQDRQGDKTIIGGHEKVICDFNCVFENQTEISHL